MTRELDGGISCIEAGMVAAIQALSRREGRLTPVERLKLHALLFNLRAVREHLGEQARTVAAEDPVPAKRLSATS